jgi:sialidase-1
MKYEILSHRTVVKTPGKFLGWPTIAYTPWGELLVAFSGNRDAHICPFGQTQMVRSKDLGQTWSDIEIINDTPLDDRDAGLLCTKSGRLILTWFTLDFSAGDYLSTLAPERQALYGPMYKKITPADRQMWTTAGCIDNNQWLRGHFVRTSDDRGKTWNPPFRTAGESPHGPVELADGRLLLLGNFSHERVHKTSLIVCEESRDGGNTWWPISYIPMFTDRPDHLQPSYLCEPHLVEAADGTLVAAFRHEIKKKGQTHETNIAEGVLYFARSTDGGKTWSKPEPSQIVGKPPHLLKLPDNRLVVSYGYRFKPPGERVTISQDNGKTWPIQNTIILREDAPTGDLGYAASAVLPDGSIYTVYYQLEPGDEKQGILATHWRLL